MPRKRHFRAACRVNIPIGVSRADFRAALAVAVLVVAITLPAPAAAQPNVTGQWSTLPYLSPVSPIHVALLNTGRVLLIEVEGRPGSARQG